MDYLSRLLKLQKLLEKLSCDAILIEDPIDLFYLTGLEMSAGKLLVSLNHSALIVDGRYFEKASQQSIYPVYLQSEDFLKELVLKLRLQTLGFDKNRTTYQNFIQLNHIAEKIVPLDSLVQHLRMIKEEEEICLIRESCQLAHQGYEFIRSLLKEGITEEEVSFELEFYWKKRGAKKLAFDSIIAFGENSSMPHYRAGNTKLRKNQHVLIDIGVVLNHYHSDMTRVVFFGDANPEIEKIYSIVNEAKENAFEICFPGTHVGELDRKAREWITSKGYGEYFTHSLGHGVGLDVHEIPVIRQTGPFSQLPLEEGMVITIEPGIYLPSIGGVRLEDTILITKTGYEVLTQSRLNL
ncbi:MAG: Xaa-Pro peptidase family protein [Parachlamydiaceae bacterium]|nr:Xaa-Pro peptidase family protein [Parachlamydiaceae bacterium]